MTATPAHQFERLRYRAHYRYGAKAVCITTAAENGTITFLHALVKKKNLKYVMEKHCCPIFIPGAVLFSFLSHLSPFLPNSDLCYVNLYHSDATGSNMKAAASACAWKLKATRFHGNPLPLLPPSHASTQKYDENTIQQLFNKTGNVSITYHLDAFAYQLLPWRSNKYYVF
jgi:hypothetical protein